MVMLVIVVAAWGGPVVHIRHKLQCVRYSGVRALSGTISIGTQHNGGGGDEDINDPDPCDPGDHHD